jgi:DNA mismatch repair protein MutS2
MSSVVVDLDPQTRSALEFDELLEWLVEFARTPGGARRVRALQPSAETARAVTELETVAETRACLATEGNLVSGSSADPTASLRSLAVAGMRLEATRLYELASVVMAAADLRVRLSSLDESRSPRLAQIGRRLPDLRGEADVVLRCVEPDGRIADHASPELRRIRQDKSRVASRLRRMLEARLRAPDAEPLIQDDFITQRNGRYVIPVRTDAPRPLRGIVHASSSSGATQFVEPLETVELNNEIVELDEAERDEQDRVLAGWSETFRERRDELLVALEILAEVDCLQARAAFARETDAVEPQLDSAGSLAFVAVRHPLLDRRLKSEGENCVPLDLELDPEDRALILSGPNTGGKTVALKTFGLTVLMAQTGIPVPAREVRLPVYRQVRADIGDHQSIEANLSTYSAHVRAVVDCLRDAAPPALFLFDEIGTGTEPTEGAALSQSILESLLVPGMTTMATTHQGALKAWALTTDGAACAALDFDAQTLRPTYRILMGSAGVSAGLDIALRLGLDPAIVDAARAHLGQDPVRSERYLNRLRELTTELDRERELLRGRADELAAARTRLEEDATRREDERRTRAAAALDRALVEFRRQARRELGEVRDDRERRRSERALAKAEARVRTEHARSKGELAPSTDGFDASAWVAPPRLHEGMEVLVRSLSKVGKVVEIRERKVEVQLGRTVFTVGRDELLVRSRADAAAPREPKRAGPRRETERGRGPDEAAAANVELSLIGKRVDEALDELDKYLDSATLAGHGQVRVIHGHGTGRLRDAVREFLRSHVHVREIRAGRPNEGGNGATVVRLH